MEFRKQENNEDTSSKEMLDIHGVGFDGCGTWQRTVQTNMASNGAKIVNTARPKAVKTDRSNSAVVNAVRVIQENAVKASACWGKRDTNRIATHVKRGWDTKIPQSSGPPKKVGDEVVHKEFGDRMEKAATTASSLEAEQDSAKANTVNGERQLQALVDKKRVIITESSIRSDLHLEDAGGIDCLPTATIFEELARMGAKSTAWNKFSSTMASAIICLAINQKFNLSKYIFDDMQAMDEIVTDVVDWAMQAPLRARFRDLSTIDMKEIIQQRMFEDNSYKAHDIYSDLYEALQKSLELDYSNQRLADQEEARKKKRKKRTSGSSQLPPPPPPSSTGASRSAQQAGSEAPAVYAWGSRISIPWIGPTYDTRFESTDFMTAQELSPKDSLMQDDSIPDEQVHLSDDEDSGNDHLPKADSRKDWWKPLPEEKRPATPEPAWTIPSSNVLDIKNNWASTLVSTYETPTKNSLLANTGDMTTFMKWYCRQFQMEECHKMFTDQIDWTNPEGDQVSVDVNQPLPLGGPLGKQSYTIDFKMKAASYPDFGLELLNSVSSNFEDLNLLPLQGHLDHLPGSDKGMLSTAVKIWTRNLEQQALFTSFKHDYTIIESPRAVVFPVDSNDRKIIRFNEIYKFSDGTLTRILEALDYIVKEFKVKRLNPGMNTRFRTEKDVTRSKEFIAEIERRESEFGLPGEIISDNGKQFQDNPFKDWCEKLCICQHFASVKHPQTNGLVERENHSLGEGIKARLDERSKNWMEELPHVLWAHRTMSSNGDTPFSLTYGMEAVIPAKIGMPTLRTAEVDLVQNDEALEINLDLLEERREQAAI
ncbi:retrovirus-related pol polyprotein from transposon TNT 1-94 [Tanacetum coccineum]